MTITKRGRPDCRHFSKRPSSNVTHSIDVVFKLLGDEVGANTYVLYTGHPRRDNGRVYYGIFLYWIEPPSGEIARARGFRVYTKPWEIVECNIGEFPEYPFRPYSYIEELYWDDGLTTATIGDTIGYSRGGVQYLMRRDDIISIYSFLWNFHHLVKTTDEAEISRKLSTYLQQKTPTEYNPGRFRVDIQSKEPLALKALKSYLKRKGVVSRLEPNNRYLRISGDDFWGLCDVFGLKYEGVVNDERVYRGPTEHFISKFDYWRERLDTATLIHNLWLHFQRRDSLNSGERKEIQSKYLNALFALGEFLDDFDITSELRVSRAKKPHHRLLIPPEDAQELKNVLDNHE